MKVNKRLPEPLLPSARRIFLGTILFGIIFVLQEIAFRVTFPLPEVLNFNRIAYSELAGEESTELRPLSNASFTWASDPDGVEFVHRLNLYGFRDQDWQLEKQSTSDRMLFVGDSFVEGFMAEDNETIPAAFQTLAIDQGIDLEVMNLGIGANDIRRYFELIRDGVPLFRPDVLVLVIYANDLPFPDYEPHWLEKPLVPEYANPWTPRAFHVVKALFSSGTVARSWTSSPFPFVPAVPNPINPWSNEKAAATFREFVSPKIAEAMSLGRFNPFVVNEFDRYKEVALESSPVEPHLRALLAFTKQFSTRLLVAFIPKRVTISDAYRVYESEFSSSDANESMLGPEYQIHPSLLRDACSALEIPFADLTTILREAENRGQRMYWNYDEHLNASGYAMVAKELFRQWIQEFANQGLADK